MQILKSQKRNEKYFDFQKCSPYKILEPKPCSMIIRVGKMGAREFKIRGKGVEGGWYVYNKYVSLSL